MLNSIDNNSISTEISESKDISQKPVELTDKNYEEDSNYTFILCPHCEKKIFYETKYTKRIRGINIKCLFCFNFFFATKCPKCKIFRQISKFIDVCETITCPPPCNNKYLQTACVIQNCPEIINFTPPRNKNLPNGFIYNHKSQLLFQKISCYFCNRPIDFITREANKVNRYYELMKLVCPYPDCKKEFNRIICINCSYVIIMELGKYIMGSKVKCPNCNFIFAKILCSECLKINPMEKSSFRYGEYLCRFSSCSKITHIAMCIYCQRMNTFKLKEGQCLIQGQCIECGYDNCKKKFSIVNCHGCHGVNPFPGDSFIFGKLYKCKYKAICSKSFMVLVCPKCWTFSRIQEEIEGKKYQCIKCGTLLSNFCCPFCYKAILDSESSYKKMQVMECPSCKNQFSFCKCYDCKKLIYYKQNKTIMGKSVRCDSCGHISVNIICKKCNVRISIENRNNDINIGETISCPNCKEDFEYTNSTEEEIVYKKNLSTIDILKGTPINLGQPEMDANFLETQKFLIFPKSYQNANKSLSQLSQNETANSTINAEEEKEKEKEKELKIIKRKLCILCQCNEKESIFYPCGHRHTCYRCSVYYFEVFKKCPKCDKPAEAIIKKIYYI